MSAVEWDTGVYANGIVVVIVSSGCGGPRLLNVAFPLYVCLNFVDLCFYRVLQLCMFTVPKNEGEKVIRKGGRRQESNKQA